VEAACEAAIENLSLGVGLWHFYFISTNRAVFYQKCILKLLIANFIFRLRSKTYILSQNKFLNISKGVLGFWGFGVLGKEYRSLTVV